MATDMITTTEDQIVADQEAQARAEAVLNERKKLREQFDKQQLDKRSAMANRVDRDRQKTNSEMFGAPSVEPEEQSDPEDDEPAITEQFAEDVETVTQAETAISTQYDGSALITKTINGKQVTRTLDQWLDAGSKIEEADVYLQEAARRYHEQKPLMPVVDKKERVKEIAKKMQLGSEEEAAEAAEELLSQAVDMANQQARAENNQAAGKVVYENFRRDFPDIVNDPVTNAAFLQLDQEAINTGKKWDSDPVRDFDLRIRELAEQVRSWKTGLADVSVKNEKKQELINKKMKMQHLDSSNTRATNKEEKVLTREQAQRQAISEMRAQRGVNR